MGPKRYTVTRNERTVAPSRFRPVRLFECGPVEAETLCTWRELTVAVRETECAGNLGRRTKPSALKVLMLLEFRYIC